MTPFRTVRLGQVIRHRKEFIRIDDLLTYKRCRVQSYAKGVVLRDVLQGAEIRTKAQQVCRSGDFLVAEIDAKVGGYGIVPSELDGAIVSSHYFLFEVDEAALDRRFLGLFVRTPAFADQVNAQGSTNYAAIRPAQVLEYEVPLPPLDEQRRIVARVEGILSRVTLASALRDDVEHAAGLIMPTAVSQRFNRLLHEEWVPLGRLGPHGSNPIQTGPFGAQLHSSEFVTSGIPVLNVGNVTPMGIRIDGLDHVTTEKASLLQRFSLLPDDLLFARTGATLGKVCLVPEACKGWLMTGHLFRVRVDRDRCDPRFLLAALQYAASVRSQVFEQVRGATRPGFNTTLLSNVSVPLPSLQVQASLVSEFDVLSARVDAIRRCQVDASDAFDALVPSVKNQALSGRM